MLRLGRHLAQTYFSPLASKLSSTWNSRGSQNSSTKSKSGNFSSTSKSGTYGMSSVRGGASSKHSVDDEESVHSMAGNSMRGILPVKDQYSARVQAAKPLGSHEMPPQTIRVETDFKVNTRG